MKTFIAILLSTMMLSGCAGLDILRKNLKGHIDIKYQDPKSESQLNITKDSLYGSLSTSNLKAQVITRDIDSPLTVKDNGIEYKNMIFQERLNDLHNQAVKQKKTIDKYNRNRKP